MKKIIFGLFLVLAMAGSALAQSPIARFIFEDAEEAFAKQDYTTTLAKLKEAEKEFGDINAPILYLRIMARNEILKASTSLDFDNLAALREDCDKYLKDYGALESVGDQAREVYRLSAELKKYPATQEEYEAKLKVEEARRREEEYRRKEQEARRLAEERRVCPACFTEMVAIPGKNYEIGKYEVTQAEWESIMGSNPSDFKGDNLPVENVSWNDIQEYIARLNQKTGKEYRLPTNIEWIIACYGGNEANKYCGGDDIDKVAWHSGGLFTSGNSEGRRHPVGELQANGYGLYDMSGNVEEWLQYCHDALIGRRCWYTHSLDVHNYNIQSHTNPTSRTVFENNTWLGFRLARTIE